MKLILLSMEHPSRHLLYWKQYKFKFLIQIFKTLMQNAHLYESDSLDNGEKVAER